MSEVRIFTARYDAWRLLIQTLISYDLT
jgi:hypothetical protein